jgi:hypothetical protein
MKLDNLILISAQPGDVCYFAWQIEVQIVNFRKFGISQNMHVLVWYPRDGTIHPMWKEIESKYTEVKFFYYVDDGVNLDLYIPQLRPHILKKHFFCNKNYLADKVFFYHDSDIIFRVLPDFEKLMEGSIIYEGDSISYTGSKYLLDKEAYAKIPDNEVVKGLSRITNTPLEFIMKNNENSGGAQYILKNITYTFWEDVEKDSLNIRDYLKNHINKKYFKSENEGYQSWTADMWAMNFNLWKRGMVTEVSPELSFSWATDLISVYEKYPIMHNAGAELSGSPKIFYKGAYINTTPYSINFDAVDPNFASFKYAEAIKEVTKS